jgi:hypothetical protein
VVNANRAQQKTNTTVFGLSRSTGWWAFAYSYLQPVCVCMSIYMLVWRQDRERKRKERRKREKGSQTQWISHFLVVGTRERICRTFWILYLSYFPSPSDSNIKRRLYICIYGWFLQFSQTSSFSPHLEQKKQSTRTFDPYRVVVKSEPTAGKCASFALTYKCGRGCTRLSWYSP